MSIAHDIRAAAVAGINALALTPTPSVVGRKTPMLPSSVFPPAISVAVSAEPDVEDLTAGTVLVRYVVSAAIYFETHGLTTDDDTIDDWVQAIQRKLHNRATFIGVSGLNDTTRKDKTPLENAALAALYNAAVVQTIVEVIEPRN